MDWIDRVGRAHFLRSLYPQAPSLRAVRIAEVELDPYGVAIRFDLNDYPAKPPVKWVQWQANTAVVRLRGWGVHSLEVRGWPVDVIADLAISEGEPDRVLLSADGPGFLLRAHVDALTVDDLSAYARSDTAAD